MKLGEFISKFNPRDYHKELKIMNTNKNMDILEIYKEPSRFNIQDHEYTPIENEIWLLIGWDKE